jgi:hypothetical protein
MNLLMMKEGVGSLDADRPQGTGHGVPVEDAIALVLAWGTIARFTILFQTSIGRASES